FQAEDGIRDFHVTGVQTCALPISDSGAVLCLAGRNRTGEGGCTLPRLSEALVARSRAGVAGPGGRAECLYAAAARHPSRPAAEQIGRASCREREEVAMGADSGARE